MAVKEEEVSSSSSPSYFPTSEDTTTATMSGGDDVVVGGGTIAEMTSPTATATTTTTDEPFMFLLEKLPPELLERILTQYLDGKSLSTLTLVSACCTSNSFYQALAYAKMPKLAVSLFTQLGKDMDDKPPPGKYEVLQKDGTTTIKRRHYAAYTQWILDQVLHPSNYSSTKRLKQHHHEKRLLMHQMRMISTILGAMDYLRAGTKNDFSTTDHWEWPIYIGQISVQWKDDSTGDTVEISPMVQILSPMIYEDEPIHFFFEDDDNIQNSFFDFSLISRRQGENQDTTTAAQPFHLVPRNLKPKPPWGRMKGLCPEDEKCLQKLADQLDTTAGRHDVTLLPVQRSTRFESELQQQFDYWVLPRSGGRSTNLDVYIMSKRQMKDRLGSSQRRYWRENPSREWVLQEEEVDSDNNDIHPLMCCWPAFEENNEHEHINHAIRLLKLRDVFLKSATTTTTSS